ncbi:MAG TPA: hypothetical protein VM010_00890 [Chitinophagaceae bacterium]|nr:hypothetical protein [Chitinophagaceae bacterium]
MYESLVQVHSIGRWIVLVLLLLAIFKSATAGRRPYVRSDNTIGILLTSFNDLMLLIGIYLWFAGPWGYKLIQNSGMGAAMKNPTARFYGVEHLVGMLIAIILIHIGKAQGKKALPDATKHRRMAIFYGIALLIILLSIPWPFRAAGAGRGWI